MPEITIIMSAFNEEKCIARSINSIIKQSFTDWELIIIDDGSTDRTFDICNHFAALDPRISVFRNETNLGLSESLNRAYKKSKSSLIARADADDVNLPDRLDKQYMFMKSRNDIDVLGTGAFLCDSMGNRLGSSFRPLVHADIVNVNIINTEFFHPSVIIRKSFFEKVGLYDVSFRRSQDKELWLRGLNYGCQYANLNEPLIEYYADGYVMSWRSIRYNLLSLYRLVRSYNVKCGMFAVALWACVVVLTKIGLYQPKQLKSKIVIN